MAQVAVKSGTKAKTGVLPIVFAALIGLGVVFVAGHVQSAALHDAAHDTRHATGFPCH
ncbi:MAG: CbtB domain-containing protein [Pikeienuella sp.]